MKRSNDMGEMKDRTGGIFPLVTAAALLAGMFIGVHFMGSSAGDRRGVLIFRQPDKVSEVLNFVKQSYVDSISPAALEDDAIRGMLKNLDPHSLYIPVQDFAAANASLEGNFSGIGIQLSMMNDTAVVVQTVADGPSEKAGIVAGDRIISIGNVTVSGMNVPVSDIVNMLKGAAGTSVAVGVRRRGTDGGGSLLDFTVRRDRIPLLSVDAAYMIAPETGYIKVNRFSRTTFDEFSAAADRLKTEGMSRMIVDLRGNPGGIIEGAVSMSEMFLPEGKLIVYTEGAARLRSSYFSKNKGRTDYSDMRLALLIDESSASASEIVAGAIQDNDRGIIIGRRSFGKGLVQEQRMLSDGSAVRITVARYFTPTGRCIQKPYGAGERSAYYSEVHLRRLHGEMTQADSMHFNDSLRYVTPGGKTVYGGGGIAPDIFVPLDTAAYSAYYRQVMSQGLVYRFSFDYADSNREELTAIADYKLLQSHLQQRGVLDEFEAYAAKQGIVASGSDMRISGALIENIAMAYIARNILDYDGFYPIINQLDKTVQRGIAALDDTNGEVNGEVI